MLTVLFVPSHNFGFVDFERLSKMKIWLEMEIGITGGEVRIIFRCFRTAPLFILHTVARQQDFIYAITLSLTDDCLLVLTATGRRC